MYCADIWLAKLVHFYRRLFETKFLLPRLARSVEHIRLYFRFRLPKYWLLVVGVGVPLIVSRGVERENGVEVEGKDGKTAMRARLSRAIR